MPAALTTASALNCCREERGEKNGERTEERAREGRVREIGGERGEKIENILKRISMYVTENGERKGDL
jgi:hypothetical protein